MSILVTLVCVVIGLCLGLFAISIWAATWAGPKKYNKSYWKDDIE